MAVTWTIRFQNILIQTWINFFVNSQTY